MDQLCCNSATQVFINTRLIHIIKVQVLCTPKSIIEEEGNMVNDKW